MSKERIEKFDKKFGVKTETVKAHVAPQLKDAAIRRIGRLGLSEGEYVRLLMINDLEKNKIRIVKRSNDHREEDW